MSSITKSDLVSDLSDATGLDKKSINNVLLALAELVKRELSMTGEIIIPGITKLKTKNTPARKTRLGINPFTREEMVFKSKPAGVKVRAIPVAGVKNIFRG